MASARPRLAVAVSEDDEAFSPDWFLLRNELEGVGITPSLRPWSDASVPWETFDLILANGAWDNIRHPDDFLAWVDRVAGMTRTVNAPAILRWNIDKHYLAVLSDAGVPTVPTTWIEPSAPPGTSDPPLPAASSWVKPSISGGGFETARYAEDEISVARVHIDRLLAAGRTAMIKPYQAGSRRRLAGRNQFDLPRRTVQPRHREVSPAPTWSGSAAEPGDTRADHRDHAN